MFYPAIRSTMTKGSIKIVVSKNYPFKSYKTAKFCANAASAFRIYQKTYKDHYETIVLSYVTE